MILKRLRARGFMRYEALDLDDLPEKGVIAIQGENESGKTTIGECIAFALFGETVKTRDTDISQVVNWSAESAEVAAEFEVGGERYRVERRVERATGRHDASLVDAGSDEPLAQGPAAVARAIRELTGLTFAEFRYSFYLAQQELGLVRRDGAGNGEGGARRALHDMIGVSTLERAAGLARRDGAARREALAEAERELAVTKSLLAGHRAPSDEVEALEREADDVSRVKERASRRQPELAATAAALREALAARDEAGRSFARFEAAVVDARAARAEAECESDLDRLAASIDAETRRLRGELEHEKRLATDTRARVDRLIQYQAKMVELEARIDLYKGEVRRALEEPKIDASDVAELEAVAVPRTPAVALKIARVRADRVRRDARRGGVLALLCFAAAAFAGVTAWKIGGVRQLVQIVQGALKGEKADAAGLYLQVWTYEVPKIFVVAGLTILAIVGAVLGIVAIGRWLKRREARQLIEGSIARLAEEVKALEQERGRLQDLDPRRPVKLAERAKDLKNQAFHEQVDKIREQWNDFFSSEIPREEQLAHERQREAQLRAESVALEERLARLDRLRREAQDPGKEPAGAPEADEPSKVEPVPIPDDLDPIEERVRRRREALEAARRERREAARELGGRRALPGEARPAAEAVKRAVTTVARSVEPADPKEAQARQAYFRESQLDRLAEEAPELEPAALRERLAREEEALRKVLPPAEALVERLRTVEEEIGAERGSAAAAEVRERGVESALAEARGRRRRAAELLEKADALEEKVEPIRREIDVLDLAAALLSEAAAGLRARLGPVLARYAEGALPLITNGRYRRVRVSPDLDIRVYSPEKNDFVPLGDLSLGAADQLLLALRLALARALAGAKGKAEERQFLFFDEPTASFDEERAEKFLGLLKEHADRFAQVFIVSHLKHEDGFERVIETALDRRILKVG